MFMPTTDTDLENRTALVAGATGLVGRALVQELLASASYRAVQVLVRRAAPELGEHAKLEVQLVDWDALPEPLPFAHDVYIALGTTLKVAGSEQAFRRVDYDYVVGVAQAARAAGSTRLAVVSALGADARSGALYNRVKGEMQEAVAGLGYASVLFAQPSLLLGDRAALGQPPRRAEAWAQRLLAPLSGLIPAGVRPISASAVAKALVAATLQAEPGVRVLASRELQPVAGA